MPVYLFTSSLFNVNLLLRRETQPRGERLSGSFNPFHVIIIRPHQSFWRINSRQWNLIHLLSNDSPLFDVFRHWYTITEQSPIGHIISLFTINKLKIRVKYATIYFIWTWILIDWISNASIAALRKHHRWNMKGFRNQSLLWYRFKFPSLTQHFMMKQIIGTWQLGYQMISTSTQFYSNIIYE